MNLPTTEPTGSAAGPPVGNAPGSSRLGFWLFVAVLAAFAAAKAVRFDTLDPDLFWHLRVADQLARDGIGPVVDHLSFTSRAQPWTPYSWLAELAMRSIWSTGGYRAAIATQAILQATFVLLLAAACGEAVIFRPHRTGGLRPGGGYATRAALATAVGVYLSLPYLSFRPVTLALTLMAGALWLALRDRRRACRTRSVWLVVPLTAVLANVHLYALMMPVAAAVLAIGDAMDRRPARRAALLAAAVAVAALATPMLPGAIRTAIFYGAHDAMVSGPIIAEMQPWGRDAGSVVMLSLLLIGVVRAKGRVPTGVLLWVGGAAAAVLVLGRFAPVLALAACPPLAAGLPFRSDRVLGRRPIVNAMAVVLLACAARIGVAFPPAKLPLSAWLDRLGPDVPGYPCAAADFVADHVAPVTGHVVNEFTWGGYLGWRLGDRWQVLLDGRTQVFPPSLWWSTYLGSDAECRAYLSTVRADAAVLPAGRSRFRLALLAQGWTVAHHDAWADVLVPGEPRVTGLDVGR